MECELITDYTSDPKIPYGPLLRMGNYGSLVIKGLLAQVHFTMVK